MRSLARAAVLSLIAASLSVTAPSAPADAEPAAFNGAITGLGSGRCVDVPGASTTDGIGLVLWDCSGQVNQVWTRLADTTIRNRGKCLTATGGAATIATCGTATNQRWTYDTTARTLRNQGTGTCLDATGGGTANNTHLILWSCGTAGNQQWRIGAAEYQPLLNVGFGGSFTTTSGYTPAPGELVDGRLTRLAGSETAEGSAVTLTGGTTGIGFAPRIALTSAKHVNRSVLAEAVVRRQAGATMAFDTLLSLAGGAYYRYASGSQTTTQFGMYGPDAPYYDTRQSEPNLSDTQNTHVALAYEYLSDTSARLEAYVNGCRVGTTVTTPVAAANAAQGLLTFGNDAGTTNRGWHGTLDAVALATMRSAAGPADFQLDAPACGGTTTPPPAGCGDNPGTSGPVIPANVILVDPCDTVDRIRQKAGQVVPNPGQLDWQRQELTAFLHYGMNTFTGVEWGSGDEDPARFDPATVNPAQWMAVLKRNGFKQVILTVKHHDGFLLYPSRYSTHSVRSSPWWGRTAQSDIVRATVDAARAAGLGVGFYLSPADGAEIPGRRGGDRFGNGSARRAVTIPTLVTGDTRTPARSYTYQADDYNAYFLNQLYELLTEYGPMTEVWFDGANPYTAYPQNYQTGDWYRLIKALQPAANIAINGPDVRWIGSESGAFRADEWSALPFTGIDPAALNRDDDLLSGAQSSDLGSAALIGRNLGRITYLSWYPAEADVSIRPGWFWKSAQNGSVKQSDALVRLYENAVGRNANLLLNVPPNQAGVLDTPDVAALDAFGATVRGRYGTELFARTGATGTAAALTDAALGTFWSPAGGAAAGAVELTACRARTFDRVLVQESIGNGQRIEAFAVDAWVGGAWRQVASAGSVGHKRILPLSAAVTSDRLRLRVTAARGIPQVATLTAYATDTAANPASC
ncbi:alpha-L-fucosidase [Actinoplanes sp. DH11]|uniref:alpha-L-fucosidase n=1 Tax=Actinoplanes sp. DH11 TaxID=2857011 RepID=UPI001E3752D7|nr:alpha-L-fucosidase [Actinoplanes sp. DH11]